MAITRNSKAPRRGTQARNQRQAETRAQTPTRVQDDSLARFEVMLKATVQAETTPLLALLEAQARMISALSARVEEAEERMTRLVEETSSDAVCAVRERIEEAESTLSGQVLHAEESLCARVEQAKDEIFRCMDDGDDRAEDLLDSFGRAKDEMTEHVTKCTESVGGALMKHVNLQMCEMQAWVGTARDVVLDRVVRAEQTLTECVADARSCVVKFIECDTREAVMDEAMRLTGIPPAMGACALCKCYAPSEDLHPLLITGEGHAVNVCQTCLDGPAVLCDECRTPIAGTETMHICDAEPPVRDSALKVIRHRRLCPKCNAARAPSASGCSLMQ